MKTKFFIFSFISLLIFFSCQQALEKPKNLLSKEEMTSILTDIYLYKQNTNHNISLSREQAFETYVSIFKIHNTTKEQFQNSYQYYYADANSLQHIYDDVIDNLKNKLNKNQQELLKKDIR